MSLWISRHLRNLYNTGPNDDEDGQQREARCSLSGESVRAPGRRRVLPSPLPESSSEDSDDSDQTDDVTDDESTPVVKHHPTPVTKASALTDYIATKAKCEGRRDLGIKALCHKYGVSKNWFARTLKAFTANGSFERKTRSCTPYKLTPHVQRCIEKVARRKRWDFTYREMVTELKARYGVALSPETIRSGLIIGGNWRVYSERDKPSLSPRHMEARLAWAKEHLGSRWVDHVDIDEKWFYEFAHKRKLKQPRSEGQGCSSARKWRNFSVKRRLWEISTSVRTSVPAFDVILVMKVPYIGQKMFA